MQLIKTVTKGWHMNCSKNPLYSAVSTSRILHRCVKYRGNKSFICPVRDIHSYSADHTHYTCYQQQQWAVVWYTTFPDTIYFTHLTQCVL